MAATAQSNEKGIGNAMFDAIMRDIEPPNLIKKETFYTFLRSTIFGDESNAITRMKAAYKDRLAERHMDTNSVVKTIILYILDEFKSGIANGPDSNFTTIQMKLKDNPTLSMDVVAEMLCNFPLNITIDTTNQLHYVSCAKWCEQLLVLLGMNNITNQLVHLTSAIVTLQNEKTKREAKRRK